MKDTIKGRISRLNSKQKNRLRDKLPLADCVIVAVGHNEFRSLSMMQLKSLFKRELSDEGKVVIDVKSLYRIDELNASGMKFWRL